MWWKRWPQSLEKLVFSLLAHRFVRFVEHQRGRTEVILDPNKVPRHNRTSTWPPFLSVLRCQRGPLNTKKCVVSDCKMNDSVFLCITSTVKAVEGIGDEKDGRNPWENWCFFCSLSDLYYFLSTRGAAQRWFWTPIRSRHTIAPRPNLRFYPFWGAKEGRWTLKSV